MVKIIVIEDEDQIREELMDWLEFEGYEVVGAANGALGLQLVLQNPPDLILSDIAMPEMNGHEVLLEVRSNPHLNHIPFIFITASAERESVRRGMDMGADDYITKPFTHQEVMQAVRSRLERSTMQAAKYEEQIEYLDAAFHEEREKRLLKSRLIAMLSHDFRTPLSAILSSSEILHTYSNKLTDERKAKHFGRIDGSIHRLIQMLDEMLVVAEMEAGQLQFNPQTVILSDLIIGIIDEFRLITAGTHRITYQPFDDVRVETDPKLIRQIVTNLLSNAIKYSSEGCEVCVELIEKEAQLKIVVVDQGIGIPEDDIPHLFEPFHRADNAKNYKGTGLGLAIVKEAAELCGGTIQVTSIVDRGTTMALAIPKESGAGSSNRY